MRRVPYPHPGEILLEEFLRPLGISQYRLAKEIHVPQRRIGEIVAGKRSITADTGLRLSRLFSLSDGFWTGLQADYDAAQAKDAMGKALREIKPLKIGEFLERVCGTADEDFMPERNQPLKAEEREPF